MIVLDFLFYYLTIWFEENKDKLQWSTPIERTVYAVGLITGLWMISIWELIEIFALKSFTLNHVPLVPGVIIILAVMQIYKYIYISKGRYKSIAVSTFKKNGNTKLRRNIAISFVLFSFMLPYLLFMIFS